MERTKLIDHISERLQGRALIWIGTRGEDALALADIPEFSGAFSLISRLATHATLASAALEDVSGVRVDLDRYDIDAHLDSPDVLQFREEILRALAGPSAIITYRPTTFASSIGFARNQRCWDLGLFAGHQFAFEHKPWLETAVARLDLPRINWRYIADIDQPDAIEFLRHGPVMLRRSRTTGGVGLVKVDDAETLMASWPDEPEAFVSVAPFVGDAVPVNVGAVVWRDGVTVHPMSLQLIGIPHCTPRPFGYCGNDFGAATAFGRETIDAVESSTIAIGEWLRATGYLGTFGVDYLVHDGVPLFTEVNPRFQGSTHLSCRIAIDNGASCIMTEHVAAFLGLAKPSTVPLREQMEDVPPMSHIVVHSVAGPSRIDPRNLVDVVRDTGSLRRADVSTAPRLLTEQGGTVVRLTIDDRVTDDGHQLTAEWSSAIDKAVSVSQITS